MFDRNILFAKFSVDLYKQILQNLPSGHVEMLQKHSPSFLVDGQVWERALEEPSSVQGGLQLDKAKTNLHKHTF